MNSNRTARMVDTLRQVVEAAHNPETPNGTTIKLQNNLEAILGEALDEVLRVAQVPTVPNGTTKRVLSILENG